MIEKSTNNLFTDSLKALANCSPREFSESYILGADRRYIPARKASHADFQALAQELENAGLSIPPALQKRLAKRRYPTLMFHVKL